MAITARMARPGTLSRLQLLGAAAVLLFALAIMVDGGPSPSGGTALASRELRFEDMVDGGVRVRDGQTSDIIAVLDPGSNGFIRGTMRALMRERKLSDLGPASPFLLTTWSDGRVTLQDIATGRTIGLEGFGATNIEAFTRFLPTREATR